MERWSPRRRAKCFRKGPKVSTPTLPHFWRNWWTLSGTLSRSITNVLSLYYLLASALVKQHTKHSYLHIKLMDLPKQHPRTPQSRQNECAWLSRAAAAGANNSNLVSSLIQETVWSPMSTLFCLLFKSFQIHEALHQIVKLHQVLTYLLFQKKQLYNFIETFGCSFFFCLFCFTGSCHWWLRIRAKRCSQVLSQVLSLSLLFLSPYSLLFGVSINLIYVFMI